MPSRYSVKYWRIRYNSQYRKTVVWCHGTSTYCSRGSKDSLSLQHPDSIRSERNILLISQDEQRPVPLTQKDICTYPRLGRCRARRQETIDRNAPIRIKKNRIRGVENAKSIYWHTISSGRWSLEDPRVRKTVVGEGGLVRWCSRSPLVDRSIVE